MPTDIQLRPLAGGGAHRRGACALVKAVEGAEDSETLAAEDLQRIAVGPLDVAVGIATSGRTPYVLGGIRYANQCGTFTIALSCNADSDITAAADLAITPVVGPEIVSGSTRLKAGTATKLVLNTLSTGAMVLLGKTFGNLMVDLQPTNSKLTARAKRIVSEATGLREHDAYEQLKNCEWQVKTAIVAWHADVPAEEARVLLNQAGGHVGRALQSIEAAQQQATPTLSNPASAKLPSAAVKP